MNVRKWSGFGFVASSARTKSEPCTPPDLSGFGFVASSARTNAGCYDEVVYVRVWLCRFFC